MLSLGSERAENVVPAILSFFFHGIGYLFQGRFFKYFVSLAISTIIWYDFYALHLVGTTIGELQQGWFDMKPDASGVHHVLMALKAVADQDHPKLWYVLSLPTLSI